ncbi:hypothetical protein DL98DRAFT_519045 [Cadophora sp. DSE1049]|nr:hypothetical protein DL98DRAFT_519045 [Cadophora sp. DSE1049]
MDETSRSAPSPSQFVAWVSDVDNWLGVTDSRRRRKIQNRVNQRIYRAKRRRETSAAKTQLVPATAGSPQVPDDEQVLGFFGFDITKEAATTIINLVRLLEPGWEGNRLVLQRFEAFATHSYTARIGALDILPSLSQYNFVKALLANTEVLGLSDEEMDDEALSPFNRLRGPLPLQPELTGTRFSSLPASLQPTELQNAVPHHPWIDLLPMPAMRDNIFRQEIDSFDEDELCHAMRGQAPENKSGLLVWRDPWEATSWEVTEDFINSWGWVIEGCVDLIYSTNIWRERRGEKPLRLPSP